MLAEALSPPLDGRVSDDPTIGTCWDADRLHLPRVAIEPDRAFFSHARRPRRRRLEAAASLRSVGAAARWDELDRLGLSFAACAGDRDGRRAPAHAFGTKLAQTRDTSSGRLEPWARIDAANERCEPPVRPLADPIGAARRGPAAQLDRAPGRSSGVGALDRPARRRRARSGWDGGRRRAVRSALRARDAPVPDQGAGDGGDSPAEGR